MTVTVAPSTEACTALVDRINSGTGYALDNVVAYSRQSITALEDISELLVEVVAVDEAQLVETLDPEDRTSHRIEIHIRNKLADVEDYTLNAMALLVRQIFQRVNNYDSADGRVAVWEVDEETRQTPDKDVLDALRVFAAQIVLRVEVEAS